MSAPSEQYQNLTSSNNGRNVVPKLQPKSHFFLQGANYTQSEAQAFGAVDEDEFRTTATVSLGEDSDIYAICSGQVLIQPQTGITADPTKVNLILRPSVQPIKGLSIKYFIYRGLNKSDFFAEDSDGDLVVQSGGSGSFLESVNQQFTDFNGSETFLAKDIGYLESDDSNYQSDEKLIGKVFFKITQTDEGDGTEDPETAYEIPFVTLGMKLGSLASGDSLGVDVVLNYGDYYIENDPNPFQLNLGFARAAEYILSADNDEWSDYEKKVMRENCTQFVDICAFYGLHANGSGKLFVDNNSTPLTTKEDIYARMAGFHTKNILYFYIQANRQRSYNFYGNYTLTNDAEETYDMKIGLSEDMMEEETFGSSGWPVHVLDLHGETAPIENVHLQLTLRANDDIRLFDIIGLVASENEKRFLSHKNLYPDTYAELDVLSYEKAISRTVSLKLTALEESAVGLISLVRYEGVNLQATESVTVDDGIEEVELAIEGINLLFPADIIKSRYKYDESSSMSQSAILSQDFLTNKYFGNRPELTDTHLLVTTENYLSSQTNEASGRVTMETIVLNSDTTIIPPFQLSTLNSEKLYQKHRTLTEDGADRYEPAFPNLLESVFFTESQSTMRGLIMKLYDSNYTKKRVIGMSLNEMNLLKTEAVDNGMKNNTVYLSSLLTGESTFMSLEGTRYKKYEIKVLGENSDGDLIILSLAEPLYIYSLDEQVFFTKSYTSGPIMKRTSLDSLVSEGITPE